MNESKTEPAEERLFKDKHSFLLFIILSITVASVIVWVSLAMYNSSGAAQLDLSRPGYKSVRSQANNGDGDLKPYSASGPISKDVINDFQATYDQQANKIKEVDAFGGDPLALTP